MEMCKRKSAEAAVGVSRVVLSQFQFKFECQFGFSWLTWLKYSGIWMFLTQLVMMYFKSEITFNIPVAFVQHKMDKIKSILLKAYELKWPDFSYQLK